MVPNSGPSVAARHGTTRIWTVAERPVRSNADTVVRYLATYPRWVGGPPFTLRCRAALSPSGSRVRNGVEAGRGSVPRCLRLEASGDIVLLFAAGSEPEARVVAVRLRRPPGRPPRALIMKLRSGPPVPHRLLRARQPGQSQPNEPAVSRA